VKGSGQVHLPSGPKGIPFLGSFLKLRRQGPLNFFQHCIPFGDHLVRFTTLGQTRYLVMSPQAMQHVLQRHYLQYLRASKPDDQIAQFLGIDSLLIADGNAWQRARHLVQPGFHRHAFTRAAETITSATNALMRSWDKLSVQEQVVDVSAAMKALTLRLVCALLFGSAIDDETIARVDAALHAIYRGIAESSLPKSLAFFRYLPFVPSHGKQKIPNAIKELDALIFTLIAEHRQHPPSTPDVLSLLLASQERSPDDRLDDRQIRNQVMTLFFAGHETTAQALAWIWYALATHPAVEEKLHAELQLVLEGRLPTADDLPRLPYTQMIVAETLRQYPPAWVFSRKATFPDRIGDFDIPAGATLLISPHVLHHHPAYWSHPEDFLPERFTQAVATGRYPEAYFPFGAGPHRCIGQELALMEASLVVATIAQKYHLSLREGQEVQAETLITQRPKGGLTMCLKRRPD